MRKCQWSWGGTCNILSVFSVKKLVMSIAEKEVDSRGGLGRWLTVTA